MFRLVFINKIAKGYFCMINDGSINRIAHGHGPT